jgi:hypothetical protein
VRHDDQCRLPGDVRVSAAIRAANLGGQFMPGLSAHHQNSHPSQNWQR